ncbi:FAD-binding oxidoreductase [Dyella halodurans]|uniref:NAD(P)/FAD-dependent oxidoreductase n=1 Tax=Dyella halodurans TaxID=1920171 RepID=A0ABV9BZV4_9GAMM|nr:FAD-binding oxidoreductase [Dyella halodurans]
MKVDALPIEDNTNGWSAILPARIPKASLNGDVSADWLVVGAGYAGLAAARRLAELRPENSVVLLEALAIGEGASGRNSGFAIDVPHNVGSSMEELEQAAHYKRLLRAGADWLEQLMQTQNIDCQWARKGKYHCAVSPRLAEKVLSVYEHELKSQCIDYQVLNREQLRDRLGTSYFHAGIYTPSDGLLNPAALVRGLADSLPPNVRLFENTPVLDLEEGTYFVAKTPLGIVRAKKVVLATNVFLPKFGYYTQRMFPIASFATLTSPLSKPQRMRIGDPEEWGVTPVNALVGATMRYTHDHRILIRQHFHYAPGYAIPASVRDRVRSEHKRVFDARFPELSDAKMEHFWAGTINITRNGAPAWGQVAPKVFAAGGCNGVGVVKQTIAGRLLAEYASGESSLLVKDMMALGAPSSLPSRPFLDLGVRGYLALERWKGRSEY